MTYLPTGVSSNCFGKFEIGESFMAYFYWQLKLIYVESKCSPTILLWFPISVSLAFGNLFQKNLLLFPNLLIFILG